MLIQSAPLELAYLAQPALHIGYLNMLKIQPLLGNRDTCPFHLDTGHRHLNQSFQEHQSLYHESSYSIQFVLVEYNSPFLSPPTYNPVLSMHIRLVCVNSSFHR